MDYCQLIHSPNCQLPYFVTEESGAERDLRKGQICKREKGFWFTG